MSYELNPKWCPIPRYEKYLISENGVVFSLKSMKCMKRTYDDHNKEYFCKLSGPQKSADFVWLSQTIKKVFQRDYVIPPPDWA